MAPRRRRTNRGANNNRVMPVASTVLLTEPSASIPLAFTLSGTGDLAVTLPSYLNGVSWRVTSVACTVACPSGVSSCLIRIFAAVSNNTTTTAVEVVARSRPILVGNAPTQIRMRNGRHVQHGATGAGVHVMEIGVLLQVTMTAIGVVNISTRGAI